MQFKVQYQNKMLRSGQIADLELSNIPIEGLVRVGTLGDGSCFFHSILMAICAKYQETDDDERQDLVATLRQELTELLPEHYPTLSQGHLKKTSKEISDYTLESLTSRLENPAVSVGHEFNELISRVLRINIYFLSRELEDVYLTGDEEFLHDAERHSIIIIYSQKSHHYELVGVDGDVLGSMPGHIITVFPPSSSIIGILDSRERARQVSDDL